MKVHQRLEFHFTRALARLPRTAQLAFAGGTPIVADGQALEPELQLLLAARRAIGSPGLCDVDPAEGRTRMERDCKVYGGPIAPVSVRNLVIESAAGRLRARHYAPAASRAPLIVYYHGGGFSLGSLDTHDAPCSLLCHEGGVNVLSIEYRLAPEHPFPAAFDDALAAFEWARAHASELGADAGRVAVAGDSSGGNLAAAVSLATAGRDGPSLQLLLYPAIDRSRPYASLHTFADGFLLTRRDIDTFSARYLDGTGAADSDPRLAPLNGPLPSGVAPALVVTATFDPLRDEGEAYVKHLRDAGVPTVHRRVAGLIHGFINLIGVSPASSAALIGIIREARRIL